MRKVRRSVCAVAAAVVGLMLTPAVASAHAYLVKTVPTPGAVLDTPPPSIQLTFDEAVEPRFAIISVTDARGVQQTTAPVSRSPSNPDTLVVPLKHLPTGWYLIYWRAISVDGHPVQGAYTFAVGPSPGPPPQFPIPHISETATDTNLLIARWAMFLSVMVAIGLFVFRTLIARPVARRVRGRQPTAALDRVPDHCGGRADRDPRVSGRVDCGRFAPLAVRRDDLVPLFRVTAFGRAYVDLELVFGLFVVAAAIALWVDRPEREQRSIAELLAMIGALGGGGVRAAHPRPRRSRCTDRSARPGADARLAAPRVRFGVARRPGRPAAAVVHAAGGPEAGRPSLTVPRFSAVALVSVLVLLASGTWASILHLPVLNALWTTSYGQAIMVKVALLAAAMVLGAINLLRTKPRLVAAKPTTSRASRRRGCCGGRSPARRCWSPAPCSRRPCSPASPRPPPRSPSSAPRSRPSVRGRSSPRHTTAPTRSSCAPRPTRRPRENSFSVEILKNGQPLEGADVTLTFEMLDMQMGNQEYQMTETSPGVYTHSAPALVMAGRWGLLFSVTPKQGSPFSALIVDHAG